MLSSSLFRRAAARSARSFSTTAARPSAKISIIGHLVAAPEVQTTNSGREILKYTVASNSGSKDNRQSSFFKVTSFSEGRSKDYLLGLLKGSLVYIEGDASLNTYQDASGANKTSLSIIHRNIEVLKRPSPPEQGE